eukprot:3944046-Prorocentrum_lima.AAC.1
MARVSSPQSHSPSPIATGDIFQWCRVPVRDCVRLLEGAALPGATRRTSSLQSKKSRHPRPNSYA